MPCSQTHSTKHEDNVCQNLGPQEIREKDDPLKNTTNKWGLLQALCRPVINTEEEVQKNTVDSKGRTEEAITHNGN